MPTDIFRWLPAHWGFNLARFSVGGSSIFCRFIHSLTHPNSAPFVGGCNTFPTVFGTVSLLLRRLFIAFNLSPAWRFRWCESWEFSVDVITKTSKNPTVASWSMRKYSRWFENRNPLFLVQWRMNTYRGFLKEQQHTCDTISIGWSVSLPDFWLTINHRIFEPTTPSFPSGNCWNSARGSWIGRILGGFSWLSWVSRKWCSSGLQVKQCSFIPSTRWALSGLV